MEPSRVLFPAQLVIPRLLDERHDTSKSFTPSPRDLLRRSRCNSIPSPIIRYDCTDRFHTIRGTCNHHTTLPMTHIYPTSRSPSTRALLPYPRHGYSFHEFGSSLLFVSHMLFRFFFRAGNEIVVLFSLSRYRYCEWTYIGQILALLYNSVRRVGVDFAYTSVPCSILATSPVMLHLRL